MTDKRLNDTERRLWVLNDEGLYNWFRSERCSMRTFLVAHRAEIDVAINRVLNRKPQS